MKDIYLWLRGAFAIESCQGDEVKFPCPYCQHPSFYFNLKKRVGFCHRAECHQKPSVSDLIGLVGYGPELAGYVPEIDNQSVSRAPVVVSLPTMSVPIHSREDRWAAKCLAYRGVNAWDIEAFDIHSTQNQIIVPVSYKGKLVQYVARFINRDMKPKNGFTKQGRRYLYFRGSKITNYLFDWDRARDWEYLTLVENTFNAIWLRGLHVTTNFGSFLSDQQVKLITGSGVKQVLFLWDEKANSTKAIKKLREAGIRADYCPLKGQPDDHGKDFLTRKIGICHNGIERGSYNPLTTLI